MGDTDPQAKRPKFEDDPGDSTEIRPIDIEDDNSHAEDSGIPTLVVERLIESITDVAVLKICRLVNKYWNSEACKILQKISEAVIPEDDPDKPDIDELLEILKAKSMEPLLSLPSPFKKANVTAMEFKNKSFREVLLHPYWEINTLSMSLSEDIPDLVWLAKFMREKTKQLKDLTITSFDLNTLDNVLRGVKLPMLINLTVNASCENELCAHMGKLADSLQDSALECLKITISSACFVFFRSLNFSQLEELNFEIEHLSEECWNMLAKVHMPALKNLTVISFDPDNDKFQKQFSSFIRNVAPTLEYLDYNFFYEVGMDFVFSNLKSIDMFALTPPTFMEYLTTERFPCLTDVTITYAFLDAVDSTQFESHDQVKIFWACSDDLENDQEEFTSFSTWITTLKKKFPNLIEFGLEKNIWTSSILSDIHRVYPHLKSIYMKGIMDFVTLSGGSVEQVAIEHVGGLSEDSDESRRISLMDFTDLETVSLYSVESGVSNDLIRLCLSRLPKLKELDIPWNSELSVEVVGSYLQHLETLSISNFDDWAKAMAELDKALPRTKVRKTY